MEKELIDHLVKVREENEVQYLTPWRVLEITISTVQAVRAHIEENHPGDYKDIEELAAALNVLARQR